VTSGVRQCGHRRAGELSSGGGRRCVVLQAFSSFWASGFKEVIVFTLIIPVLLWRSLTSHHHEDESE
jgi:branched-chain amino acid transport system permease protein